MKKTISINISGAIFHIEEDGYDKLRAYLGSVQQYFAAYEDSQEIVTDIENRIAEKLAKRLKATGSQAITLEDVTDLISSMGTVADFEASDDDDVLGTDSLRPRTDAAVPPLAIDPNLGQAANTSATGAGSAGATSASPRRLVRDLRRRTAGGVASGLAHYFDIDPVWVRLAFVSLVVVFPALSGANHGEGRGFGQLAGIAVLGYIALWIALPGVLDIEENKTIRKFYRNPSDKVLGGVASGLAAYFGLEVGLVRLLFVLTIPVVGLGFLVYVTLWLIAPMADSLTKKMEMQGRPITLSNIEESIRNSLSATANTPETSISRVLLLPFRAVAVVFDALGRAVGPVLGTVGMLLRVFTGVTVLFTALAFLLAGVALFGAMAGWWMSTSFGPDGGRSPYWVQVVRNESNGLLLMSGAVFFGIMWFWLLLVGLWLLTKRRIISVGTGFVLATVQVLALVILTAKSVEIADNFRREGSVEVTQTLLTTGMPTFDLHDIDTDYDRQPALQLEGYSGKAIVLEQRFQAKGHDRAEAEANARQIRYGLIRRDSLIVFDKAIDLLPNARFRDQQLDMILKIPYGQPFRMTKDFGYFVNGSFANGDELTEAEHQHGTEAIWQLTSGGTLICLNFPRESLTERQEKIDEETNQNIDNQDQDSVIVIPPVPPILPGSTVRTMPVEAFNAINVNGNFQVVVQRGDVCKLAGTGNVADLDRIRVVVRASTLTIDVPDDEISVPVLLTITLPKPEKISLDGTATLHLNGFDNLKTLQTNLSGESLADLKMTVQTLTLNAQNDTKVLLHGQTEQLTATLSDQAALNARQMEVGQATIRASNSSRATLGKVKSLRSTIADEAQIK